MRWTAYLDHPVQTVFDYYLDVIVFQSFDAALSFKNYLVQIKGLPTYNFLLMVHNTTCESGQLVHNCKVQKYDSVGKKLAKPEDN